jgi:xanthine dehydrogenase YagR molybdenum-binding subunit
MSIAMKAFELLAKVLPDRDIDPLSRSDHEIGKPLSRVDGPEKVKGEAQYTGDIPIHGLTHAAVVCSTIASGRIVEIDVREAEQAPGVVFIMTYKNAPRMGEAPLLLDMKGASFTRLPVLQDPVIRWNGEPVAVVVAETGEQADNAASLVRVIYQSEPAQIDFNAAKGAARQPGDVLGQPAELKKGDAETALASAFVVVDEIYRTPRHNHCAIELHTTTAQWHGDDCLTMYDASQAVSLTKATLAKIFRLKPKNVRVISRFVGGGFGNKMAWNHQVLCAAAAKLSGRPVRLVLNREDVFRTTGGRTLSEQRVALGANSDGALAALIHTGVTATGIKNGFAEQFTFPTRHLYASDSYYIEQKVVELHMVANASMRAPGESIGTFALESALDELAAKLQVDPIELRRRIEPSKDPTKGNLFSARNLLQAYRHGAERFGWERRSATPRSRRDGEWWVGTGMATATYPYQRFPGAKVSIRLTADGAAVVRSAAHEMGMGTATVQAQHAADRLGLPVEKVAFEYGDSDMPNGVPAGGSAQTASIIAAVVPACMSLFKVMLRLAGNDSPLAGARIGEVEPRGGGLYLKGKEAGESYSSILRRAGRDHVECQATSSMPFEMMKYSMHSFGAQFCEVRVNEVTGEVRVTRWCGSFDSGRILNPKTAASQFRGGVVMGIGAALTEATIFDERYGRIMNRSLAEYHVPVHADIPEIDVTWLDIPDPLAPMGGKGIGEIGITGVAAAIANAVYNATGKRIRDLPITPDKVLMVPADC